MTPSRPSTRLSRLFRERRLPIISVQHLNPKDHLEPGEEGFDLPESLTILPSDVHIHKTYGNAFNKTPLVECLRGMGVDTVIITGYCAEYCVLATCVGAEDVDLMPIILLGSLASPVPDHIRFVERINDVISYGALETVLE